MPNWYVFNSLSVCFFQNVGQVVRVRLVVDNRGVFMGDAFVEFASNDQANKVMRLTDYDHLRTSCFTRVITDFF